MLMSKYIAIVLGHTDKILYEAKKQLLPWSC